MAASADRPTPSQWQVDEDNLFGRIRRALKTPIVNSLWRELAGRGEPEPAWAHLQPQVPATFAYIRTLPRVLVLAASSAE